MRVCEKSKSQKLRFLTVGLANTLIDFSILFILESRGLMPLVANIFSTSVAFTFSYIANRKFTFKSRNSNLKHEIGLFIGVTLLGLWGVQSLVIFAFLRLFTETGLPSDGILLAAKIVATSASLAWNYVLYSKVVFKDLNAGSRQQDE